jgi:oligopeptide/dipeptide ABC transporter ATP-binding protein
VRHISDRVMVMYLGKAVELAGRDELYAHPKHPYTGALLSAVPIPDPDRGRERKSVVLEGDVPSPINPPSACNFHPRCPRFHEGRCDVDTPPLDPVAQGHFVACHYPLERWPMDMHLDAPAAAAAEQAG